MGEYGLGARRAWLKAVVNRCGLQTLLDDVDIVVAELAREWAEDDKGAALYLENAHAVVRQAAIDIAPC